MKNITIATLILSLIAMASLYHAPAYASEMVVVQGTRYARHPPYITVYSVGEIDQFLSQVREASISGTSTAKNELRTEMQSIQRSVQEQVTTALEKLPDTVFSNEAKQKLTIELSETVANQINEDLRRFKADLKKEVVDLVNERLAADR